ncbi:hypothetical protein [Streptosporangium subroseum]|uniref:hypothetical protein n=1 Tax=Streptosporangium subroseum TaxID=106412 RepID=UPI003F4DBBC1
MSSISRRHVLKTAAAVAAIGAGRLSLGPQPLALAAEATTKGAASRPVSMAMHIHASWGEGNGTMRGHLDQATRAGIDVLWWTEHDFRMAEHGYPNLVHMNGPAEQVNGVAILVSRSRNFGYGIQVLRSRSQPQTMAWPDPGSTGPTMTATEVC